MTEALWGSHTIATPKALAAHATQLHHASHKEETHKESNKQGRIHKTQEVLYTRLRRHFTKRQVDSRSPRKISSQPSVRVHPPPRNASPLDHIKHQEDREPPT